jgi:undecaprenyl-diphosphatase
MTAQLTSEADAARFSFLLATPITGAAAALKLPDLLGPQGGRVWAGSPGAA